MPAPDPIPVYAGDDWSFAFTYREPVVSGGSNGAPVDLTGCTIVGALYIPFSPTPIALTAADGQAGFIAASEGQFGVGTRRSLTATVPPSPATKGAPAALHVFILDAAGLLRTTGVFPLLVLGPRDPWPDELVSRIITDPVSGRTLTFDGLTDLFPAAMGSGGPLLLNGAPVTLNAQPINFTKVS